MIDPDNYWKNYFDDNGWWSKKPTYVCYDDTNIERNLQNTCEMLCATCVPPVYECDACKRKLCSYHYGCHLKDVSYYKSDPRNYFSPKFFNQMYYGYKRKVISEKLNVSINDKKKDGIKYLYKKHPEYFNW